MIQKTYAITNLVDWKAQISAGKAKVIVHFTGGAITAYGITPAEYTTANPFFQHVIEESDYFKSGRIILAREVEVEDDAATKARKMREAQRKAAEEVQRTAAASAVNNETGEKHPQADSGEVGVTVVSAETPTEEVGDDDADNDDTTTHKADNDGKTVVEASCREDVVEYLKANFNYTATQLRTKGALMQALNDHNLVVVGVEL